MQRVLVVGAGIIGTLSAYYLARAGFEVTVAEREHNSAMKCSYANGGQISVCNAQTWNTWANVAKGLKWMTSKDAPLLIRPTPELAKLKWLAGFLWHTANGSYIKNTIDTIHLGLASRDEYDRITTEEGLEYSQSKCGLLHVYTNFESMNEARSMRGIFEANNVEWDPVTPKEIITIDPGLRNFNSLVGGVWTKSDWTGDAHLFVQELTKVLQQKYKVKFYYDAPVLVSDITQMLDVGEFDKVVLSNGHHIAAYAKAFGDSLNIYPVKGYSITIDNVGPRAPTVSLLDDDKKIVSSRIGNTLRVAGTAELTGENYDITHDRVQPLLNWVHQNFPAIDTRSYRSWACLRPMNSNMMPIVRESKRKNVWYHGGHGHLGWTLGAGTAKDLAQMMAKG